MNNAREIAINILNEVHTHDAYANVALAKHLRSSKLAEVDRRFLTELVYGAVKAGDTLDWIIRQYINRPLNKIEPMVREILRIGMYQLFFLDKVPASAACNTAVELTKKYSHAGTVKFVNAVLRTAAREPERAKFPHGKGHAIEELALKSQHPYWLVKKWVHEFGLADTERLCDFDNSAPVLSIRTNTLKTSREDFKVLLEKCGLEVTKSKYAPEGLIISSYGSLDNLEPLQNGLGQVQDESSMLVAHVLSPKSGEFIIDCCSAPGGKTTHIAALMNNKGKILATDIFEHKLKRIKENADRLGIDIINTKLLDATKIGEIYSKKADRVLVDAPCSGLGVLRRKADARWKKKADEIAKLPQLQLEILNSAARAVKVGGVLVYSTCTIEQAENADVVQRFLQENDNFILENTGAFLPVPREGKMVQLYPHKDATDGFFIARMKRRN